MLTADLAMSRARGNRVEPYRINPDDESYLEMAGDLVAIFSEHQGRRHAELDAELEEYVGTGTDYKIVRGLIKLLSDQCRFETSSVIDPAEIRRALFLKARLRHPLSEASREQVIAEMAQETGLPPEELEENIYADLWGNQRLASFEELDPKELIDRYNLAQAQALLYRCAEIRLRVEPQAA